MERSACGIVNFVRTVAPSRILHSGEPGSSQPLPAPLPHLLTYMYVVYMNYECEEATYSTVVRERESMYVNMLCHTGRMERGGNGKTERDT